LGLWEDAGEDGSEDLAASPATHQLCSAFRIGMMSGGDKMKEPMFRIPCLEFNMVTCCRSSNILREKKKKKKKATHVLIDGLGNIE